MIAAVGLASVLYIANREIAGGHSVGGEVLPLPGGACSR